MLQALPLVLVLLAAAVVVVVACRLVRLPPIMGYLIVGAAVGPHALGWVGDESTTRNVAEFGIVFLLFSVGLEFSLPKLRAMRPCVRLSSSCSVSWRSTIAVEDMATVPPSRIATSGARP